MELINQYIAEWGWLIIVATAGLVLKDTIKNLFIGLQFLWGNDFNIDDTVYINGNKKARIVRQNIWKTTFYVYDHHRKFIVPNNMLWELHLEKDLPSEKVDI
jgi:small-conductance mechanosensitive channel